MPARFVLHPVLLNKRSRLIFIWFLFVALFLGLALFWKLDQIITQIGLSPVVPLKSGPWYIKVLFSLHFKYSLVLAAALLGGALTAHHVVGPIKRMEQWILDWEAGKNISEFRVRQKDKFSPLTDLLNQIREKLTPSK